MRSYIDRLLSETPLHQDVRLPGAGTPLENPWVFDAGAKDVQAMASRGDVDIVHQQTRMVAGQEVITDLTFRRCR